MRKKILIWLMALGMLFPTVCANAAEALPSASAGQEAKETMATPSKVSETDATADPTESPEQEEATPIPAGTPRETVTPVPTPEATPAEEATPTPEATPEVTPVVTATPTPEATPAVTATPTPEVTPAVTVTSTPSSTPVSTATPAATATPTPAAALATPKEKEAARTYKLSHAGIIQEAEFPDDGFVMVDELGEQVDLEGVKAHIVQSLLERKEEIDISQYQIPVLYIDQVISETLNENPQFFYVSFDDCIVEGTTAMSVIPIYEGSREEIAYASAAYEQAVAKALAGIDSSMNAMEKAFVLHDYLVSHCEYDKTYRKYTAEDALVYGSAVCQGYTLAYADLMRRAGIPCVNVPSDAMDHIWNMISIDGSWYHVDATWDDPSNFTAKSYCRHNNFLASDAQITAEGHNNWSAPYRASSTRFDNAEWKDWESILCKYQGDWYYMGTVGGVKGLIRRTGSLENGTSSVVQQITDNWYVWGGTGSYWVGLFGYITVHNNTIYFNGRDNIYKYEDGQVKKIYTYTGNQGYLYDIIVENGRLYCGVSQSYDKSVSYVEVIDPDHLPFSDVAEVPGNWKFESIKYVYVNGIMNGINGTDRFDPDEPLTRAMFATVLYRMAGEPSVAFENRFSDVQNGRYYSSAIIWAYREGIVNGYADGSYGVDDYITREQIAKMLRIYAQVRGYSTSERADISSYPDALEVSGWATEHMSWAVGCGMVNGKNVGGTYYLDARGNATRAECAAMLTRFMGRYGN